MTIHLLAIGGLLHFGILVASALTPRALDWRGALASLPIMLRQLFWVYGAFIVLVIASFGILTLCFMQELAAGEALARGFCAFVAVFWLARLGVQFFVFDARPYLTNWFYRLGYHALTVVFASLSGLYACAALGLGKGLL
jgi:hypothetical protein